MNVLGFSVFAGLCVGAILTVKWLWRDLNKPRREQTFREWADDQW